jgi:signal transduction histidine kinase
MYQKEANLPWIVIIATIIIVVISLGLILLFLIFQNKRQRHIKETQWLKDRFHQTLLQSQLEIKEQILQHISRELHDNLGQIASLIKINLNTLALQDVIKAGEKIEDTKELTRRLITDIKSLSVSLGSDNLLRSGLARSIQSEVERLNKTGRFSATFEQEGAPGVIDNDRAVILYRMVQEILNNVIKHSNATQIDVVLTGEEKSITLALSDNGAGFNIGEKINSGAGLTNLQNRAGLIGAKFAMQSSPGNGTFVKIELPL